MTHTIDPRTLYPNASFFLDYIERGSATDGFFEHSLSNVDHLVTARQSIPVLETRVAACDALDQYNQKLNASDETLANIQRLRDASAVCVIGGQQAGFLGGPLFVLYKIASVIRSASWLSDQLNLPVVPLFWLATEDHDFAEINHIRWLDDSSSVRTLSFEWDDQGRPIEHLQITSAIQRAFAEACQKIPFSRSTDAATFTPASGDDYGSWHARIWSRLFARHGLILVEPRVLRPLAKSFFVRALSDTIAIRERLTESAAQLSERGFSIPLDPAHSGTLFDISGASRRRHVEHASDGISQATSDVNPATLSTDAALRPLLVDSLLPTIANVLGPSELAYHAMLLPLYRHWNIPQPLAIPRQGATVMTDIERKLLDDANLRLGEVLDASFDPAHVLKQLASDDLGNAFREAHTRLERALYPLKDHLSSLDPGLEARWRQTVDQASHQIDKLQDRAIRAELARSGIPVKQLRNLKPRLRPMEQPQERVLSAFSFVARYGVEWLEQLITHGEPTRFEHQLIVTKEPHG